MTRLIEAYNLQQKIVIKLNFRGNYNKCIEFTACTYNFKNFAVRSTIKTVENTLEKEEKKKKN